MGGPFFLALGQAVTCQSCPQRVGLALTSCSIGWPFGVGGSWFGRDPWSPSRRQPSSPQGLPASAPDQAGWHSSQPCQCFCKPHLWQRYGLHIRIFDACYDRRSVLETSFLLGFFTIQDHIFCNSFRLIRAQFHLPIWSH